MLLLDAAIRVTAVALVVAAIVAATRLRSSAAQHAAWTGVLMAMLLMPVLPRLMPAMPLMPASMPRVERVEQLMTRSNSHVAPGVETAAPSVPPQQSSAQVPAPVTVAVAIPQPPRVSWPAVFLAIYVAVAGVLLLRVLAGWFATSRLIRRARRAAIEADDALLESDALASPVSAGVFRTRIILPAAWQSWSAEKLDAVLAHERAHVSRRDPLVSLLVRLNCCLFWFHPLAWWLDRKLAALAEHACDEAAVRATGGCHRYAELLLEIAAAANRAHGRVAWAAVRADGSGLIGRRIDRLLSDDHGRCASRMQKSVLVVGCVAAVIGVAACQQEPAPLRENPEFVQREERNRARAELYESSKNMTPALVAAAEAAWKANPDDLTTLEKILIYYGPEYSGKDSRDQKQVITARRPYILWLIEHHPEHDLAGSWGARIFTTPRDPLPDPEGYESAKKLWLSHAELPDVTAPVLGHAASFFEVQDRALAEQMLVRAIALDPNGRWSHSLGRLYALMLLGSDASMPLNVIRSSNEQLAASVFDDIRLKLEQSSDARLLAGAGEYLMHQGVNRRRWTPLAFDVEALATTCLERAVKLDPGLTTAARILASHGEHQQQVALSERFRGVPPEKLPEALARLSDRERFETLPTFAANTYIRGNRATNKNDRATADAEYARSKQWALDLLALAPQFRDHPRYGATVYRANLALATQALREGDRQTSVRYLRAAAGAPPSEGFTAEYIDSEMQLTNYLLKHGERESVAEFMEKSAALRPLARERLLRDAALIRSGVMPTPFNAMMRREATPIAVR